MKQQTVPVRDPGLDAVRSAAILLVLLTHAASAGLVTVPGTFDWYGALIWGALARPSVPLFFMCSGALLLCRELTPRRILTHHMPHILCPMFIWAFFYRLLSLLDQGVTAAGVLDAVKRTILLQHEFHFYYLHILLLVYLFLPAVRVFVRSASRREMEYLLALWWLTGILLPLLSSFWPFTLVHQINTWYKMNQAYAALGYSLLGYYLRQYGGQFRPRQYILAFLCGYGLTFGGCAVTSLRDAALNETFLEGMTPGPMLMAFGLFGLLLFRKHWPAGVVKVTGRLARASFCIYLVHVCFLLRVLPRLGVSGGTSPCLIWVPVTCLLLALAGWLTWEVLHCIPVVKKYLI